MTPMTLHRDSSSPAKRRLVRTGQLATLLCILGSSPLPAADPWIPSDLYVPPENFSSAAWGIGVAANNDIFAVGTARYDQITGAFSALIRKKAAGQTGWRDVDNYLVDGWTRAKYTSFGAAADGTLYAAGEIWKLLPNSQWKAAWSVQQSTDGGEKWVNTEIYEENNPDFTNLSCADIKGHPTIGVVYAVGSSTKNGYNWEVRRKAGTSPFETVDVVGPTFYPTQASGVAFHGTNVLVVGRVDYGAGWIWTVRRSSVNGVNGGPWVTVDTFKDSTGTLSEALGIGVDNRTGAIYVCGRAGQVLAKRQTVCNWAVRRSLDGGTTWTTVDRFGAQPANMGVGDVMARAATVTPSGTVFVTGVTPPPSRLIVRKGTTNSNGAMTWVTSDDVPTAHGRGIASDAYGNIFSAGQGEILPDGTGKFQTRLLKGAP